MQIDRLRTMLDAPAEAEAWFRPLGFADVRTGHSNLLRLASAGVPLDLLCTLCEQFAAAAHKLADPDMALNNLERYLLAGRSPLSTAALFERDPHALAPLLMLFSASQHLADMLRNDPESYDLLRMTAGRAVARDLLVEELIAEIRALSSEDEVMAALRRFKRRETLRIAYGDIVKNHSVAKVTRQISYVADACVEAALDFARREVAEKQSRRNGRDGPPPRFVILALGKLGGRELNYSSDIDLVMLYQDPDAETRAAASDGGEYAQRLAREVIRLLTETTDLGFAYRVDMRLRPEGRQGQLATRVDQALAYYDTRGRTWERQAYIKARAIAGDIELGKSYLRQLRPWIYRRYLSLADITGIKGLKRKIEKHAEDAGVAARHVKTGRGGIRDIEFVIQFLQLLNGGASRSVRTGNTLTAIERLEQAGCLTHQERTILEDNYSFLRKVEHRLQIMFDLQTHELPVSDAELTKLARRLGYRATESATPLEAFKKDYADRTAVNRRILDHLLHDAFPEQAAEEPEIDLVNEPDPSPETIAAVLGRYPFQDVETAYDNLMSLAAESIPFLSTRRCRLFLAAIAPRLLSAIAQTPDPDATLVTLSRVSDSLGGKGALWELFSSNPATLQLYVKLCAACPYLAGILTSNPGMIDELLDSLVLEKLPDLARLEASIAELVRGAEDLEPILLSFKNVQHLRVGVRDIVGKDDVKDTHAALSDIAEACLREIAAKETARLVEKLGQPTIGPLPELDGPPPPWQPPRTEVGSPSDLIILALGKLGGREPNYHSDLDIVFLYEAEGSTRPGRRGASTSNSHFFSELGQRIIKAANQFGPHGRLYEVDPRLRPTGKSGPLAMPLASFVRYFQSGEGQLWERLALCKSRVIVAGVPEAATRAMEAVAASVYCRPWRAEDAAEILQMRQRLKDSASPMNIKRGAGGTMDTEFVVQMLQLKHGRQLPEIRVPGTLAALKALSTAGLLSGDDAQALAASYRFQRSIEARIRLMDAAGRHEFPDEPRELAKLAYLLGYDEPQRLAQEVDAVRRDTRDRFERIFSRAAE
ncbi:MAG: bifunctional [glutamate--ammonia ligase]-adenylyl-L-tyrosine phosphorylase/[glutamate--ammonia-ligase] adenylyltransferase [Planctomycetota bacterium]|nr:MAG: bifunctional [glutamate--ammonia ligase]-adenylyl-L-tyrosine phosphorylase/[glutamate--ammonia-ligase] adenylyltransferase [Planctomycetota bacterium]